MEDALLQLLTHLAQLVRLVNILKTPLVQTAALPIIPRLTLIYRVQFGDRGQKNMALMCASVLSLSILLKFCIRK